MDAPPDRTPARPIEDWRLLPDRPQAHRRR
jgi:hypothetical protein